MKKLIIIAVALTALVGCKKEEIKSTLPTEPDRPKTIEETKLLIQGTWLCDSVQKFGPSGYLSTVLYDGTNTFNNGVCTAFFVGDNFSYSYLNAYTLIATSWGSPSYNNSFADADQMIIDKLNTTHLTLRCVHLFNYGEIVRYDIRYYRRN